MIPSCQALLDLSAITVSCSESKKGEVYVPRPHSPLTPPPPILSPLLGPKPDVSEGISEQRKHSEIVSNLVIPKYSSSLQYFVAQELPDPAAVCLSTMIMNRRGKIIQYY